MRAGLERSRLTGLDMEHLIASADAAGDRDAMSEIRCKMGAQLSMRRIQDVIDEALWACDRLVWADLRDVERDWVSEVLPRHYSNAYHEAHAEALEVTR